MRFKRKNGFTLIEVVLIIALLGSIIAIAAPSIFGADGKAKIEACQDQMDFILNGFQTHQFDSKSPYAFGDLTDGEDKLNAYIAKAIDSSEYINIGFEDQVVCPSNTPTAYEAAIKDEKLFVYCPTHDVYSHGSLSPRPPKSDPTKYTTLEKWINTDNNWIVGDHESFFVLPIQDQYYHMEIGFQLFPYDNESGTDEPGDSIYEYHYDDPEWYLEIPTDLYDVTTSGENDGRDLGYIMKNYNPPKKDIAFALAIDFQETEDGYDFTSNALELKNINSNAGEELTLDVMVESEFNSEVTVDKPHNRLFFDGLTDWMVVDIVPDESNEQEKTMYVHMLDADDEFQQLFVMNVPVADLENGDVKFAFFMGKRVEDEVVFDDGSVSNGFYYDSAFPSPIQVMINDWIVDYDGTDDQTGHPYSYWYDTEKYDAYEESHTYMINN
jgi:type II secretory pathway pseudopilin PulG